MLNVLLAGGGTAGHINPALAIAEIIKANRDDVKFLFAGTPDGMEAKLIKKAGYDFAPIRVKGFQRKLSLKNIGRNIGAAGCLITAGPRASQIIHGFKPDLVIGTGGYVSGPVVMKAHQMGIPTVIHEQNAYPGVTTRLLSKGADMVMLTVEEALECLDNDIKYTVTGLPVRHAISAMNKADARKLLGIDDSLCILSFGGSLGAGKINEVAAALIKWETENGLAINHIHGYGGMGKKTFIKSLEDEKVNLSNNRLIIKEYIDNMDVCMAAADIVICRSGANTLSEIETVGKASILIPSPIVAGNHQYHNAMVLGNAGAAVVIEQKDVTNEFIIDKVTEFYNNRGLVREFSENAAKLAVKDVNQRIWRVISEVLESSAK